MNHASLVQGNEVGDEQRQSAIVKQPPHIDVPILSQYFRWYRFAREGYDFMLNLLGRWGKTGKETSQLESRFPLFHHCLQLLGPFYLFQLCHCCYLTRLSSLSSAGFQIQVVFLLWQRRSEDQMQTSESRDNR